MLTALLLALSLAQATATVDQGGVGVDGSMHLTVALISDDLEIKPVPKWSFTLSGNDGAEPVKIVTSFTGEATAVLRAGVYVITSDKPLVFEGKEFHWSAELSINAGEELRLELSNDNAEVAEVKVAKPRVPTDEGELYQGVKGSVFKVLSESGHGSGFLIDSANGLIATNHHVIVDSDYLAVKINPQSKYRARLVASDEVNDVAILQVAPSVLEHLDQLELAPRSESQVHVGDRVLAVGSPLATETILTTGIVSKVESDAIYSDVNINEGNSGGPLFNAQSEVVGISTFGLPGKGPGIAGIVRVHLLHNLKDSLSAGALSPAPDPQPLPVESTFRFPARELREVAMKRNPNLATYHVEAGKFDVQLLTPVLVACLEVAGEKEAAAFREKRSRKRNKTEAKAYTPGKDFYEWRKYAGDYRAVVQIQAVPEIALTGGSVFAAVMLGANAPQKYKFKADFDRMELWRGETLVRPIHPRRWASVTNLRQGAASMNDIGFYGSYEYPPEAFKPGETLTLKVWRQGKPKPKVKIIPAHQQAQVWRDFRPYFEALQEEVGQAEIGSAASSD